MPLTCAQTRHAWKWYSNNSVIHSWNNTEESQKWSDAGNPQTESKCRATQPGLCVYVYVCVCVGQSVLCLAKEAAAESSVLLHSSCDISGNRCRLFVALVHYRSAEHTEILSLAAVFLASLRRLCWLSEILFPVHVAPDDGASEGLWNLFAGTFFFSVLSHCFVYDFKAVSQFTYSHTTVCKPLQWTWVQLQH